MHYFDYDESLNSNEQIHRIKIKDKNYNFITDNGVFSKRGLDFGTRTLLETIPVEIVTGKILDIGCGYGPIGIYIKSNCDSEVDMIDINDRSINLAIKNAKLNNVNVNIFKSNGYENIKDKYNFIISNPPIRVGKKILYELLFKAKEYLKPDGELWIVVNKNQGAKSLIHDLEKEYNVEVIRKNKGFYVIKAALI